MQDRKKFITPKKGERPACSPPTIDPQSERNDFSSSMTTDESSFSSLMKRSTSSLEFSSLHDSNSSKSQKTPSRLTPNSGLNTPFSKKNSFDNWSPIPPESMARGSSSTFILFAANNSTMSVDTSNDYSEILASQSPLSLDIMSPELKEQNLGTPERELEYYNPDAQVQKTYQLMKFQTEQFNNVLVSQPKELMARELETSSEFHGFHQDILKLKAQDLNDFDPAIDEFELFEPFPQELDAQRDTNELNFINKNGLPEFSSFTFDGENYLTAVQETKAPKTKLDHDIAIGHTLGCIFSKLGTWQYQYYPDYSLNVMDVITFHNAIKSALQGSGRISTRYFLMNSRLERYVTKLQSEYPAHFEHRELLRDACNSAVSLYQADVARALQAANVCEKIAIEVKKLARIVSWSFFIYFAIVFGRGILMPRGEFVVTCLTPWLAEKQIEVNEDEIASLHNCYHTCMAAKKLFGTTDSKQCVLECANLLNLGKNRLTSGGNCKGAWPAARLIYDKVKKMDDIRL